MYKTYECSPSISSHPKAYLTLNIFQKHGDGGGLSKCESIILMTLQWLHFSLDGSNKRYRCLNNITISANGRSVVAMVVDECDFTMGCDEDHDYQLPCQNNIVDASKVVWKALGVHHDQWGGLEITWSPNA